MGNRLHVREELRSLASIGRRVVNSARHLRVTFLAASVAYYAFVSLIPALLLLLVVASSLFGEVFAMRVLALVGEFLTPAGEEVVADALEGEDAPGRGGATLVGIGVLVWSTLKVFRALDTAFLLVYGVDEDVDFVAQMIDAATVVLGIGVGLAAMIGVGTVLGTLDVLPGLRLASVLVLPVLLTIVFLPMYYVLPYPNVTAREALPGAAFAGVSWTVLQTGFQVYAANAGQYQVYGVVGAILLLVTWLYLASIVVIVGAILNVVLAEGRAPGFENGPDDAPFSLEREPDR